MGWTGHRLPKEGWSLFTRGGTEGVFVSWNGDTEMRVFKRNEEIPIPAEMLKMLVAGDIRIQRMRELEEMKDDEILGLKRKE